MRIDDLILALQRGINPNAAILAQAQADAGPAPAAMSPPVSQALGAAAANANINTDVATEEARAKAAADAAVIDAGLSPRPPIPAGGTPVPRPRPAEAAPKPAPPPVTAAPEGVRTPITNPIPTDAAPRIMQSPPDLSNMYLELIKKNQNARALDSGLSLIAAGLSNSPQNRAGLISGAFNQSGAQNLSSQDLINLHKLNLDNQSLAIRQAAKASLMKRYKMDRDTIDYLDASGKLDEVIKHQNTGTLVQIEDSETGQKWLYNNATGERVAAIGGPKPEEGEYVDTPEGRRLMSKRTGKPMGEPVGAKEDTEFVDTPEGKRLMSKTTGQPIGPPVGKDDPTEFVQGPNGTELRNKKTGEAIGTPLGLKPSELETNLTAINKERLLAGQPALTREDYIKSVQRAPANEQDQLNLDAINAGFRAKGKPEIDMAEYIKKYKGTGVTVNVGPQGQQFPAPPTGQDYYRNEADGTVKIFEDGKPRLYTLDKAEPLTTDLAAKQKELTEAQKKENKAKTMQAMSANNVVNAADRALELVNNLGVTGFGSKWMRAVSPGGTSADSFDARVSSINANSAITALQNMRESNQTGGGVGNVTDFEQRMLAATTDDLRYIQKPQDAEKALIRVKAAFLTLLEQRYENATDIGKFNADFKRNIDELTAQNENKKAGRGGSRVKGVIRIGD